MEHQLHLLLRHQPFFKNIEFEGIGSLAKFYPKFYKVLKMTSSLLPNSFAIENPQPSLLEDLLVAIITPGFGPRLVAIVNASLLLLIAVTIWMAWQVDRYYEQASELLPLLYVGVVLAIGLLLSFNYFAQVKLTRTSEKKMEEKTE